jgi:hypothetical protein
MGFRFRKKIKIAPGVAINIGKKGVNSVSLGGKGFTSNVNANGVKNTIGIPGSGLSYETKREKSYSSGSFIAIFVVLFILYLIFK